MSELGNSIYEKSTTIAFVAQRTRLWSRLGMMFYMVLLYQLIQWVFGLPDITTSQAAIISIVTGMSTPLTAFYLRTGKMLYDYYGNMTYSNSVIALIDHIGFILDKFRIFPLMMMFFYGIMFYTSIHWAMDLGSDISMQQVAFLTSLSSSITLIFGFFIASGEVNMQLEDAYTERHDINEDIPEPSQSIDTVINQYIKDTK